MDDQVKLFPDGQLVEYKNGMPIRQVATHGNINELIKALKFSRTSNFILSCDERAPQDDISQSRGDKHINEVGLKLLTTFEGCELNSYDDGVGVWTIGYGHTAEVGPGMTIDQAQAEALLLQDLEEFETYVTDLAKVDLNADQFSALVCLCYNTGPEAFGDSTLLQLLNNSNFEEAAHQFLRWNKGGGEPMLGLTRRRLAEQALFKSQPWAFAQAYEGPLNLFEMGGSGSSQEQRSLQLTNPPMTGDDIRQLQQGLINAGLVVEANGVFDTATESALRQWQAREGWTVDGIAGSSLVAALT